MLRALFLTGILAFGLNSFSQEKFQFNENANRFIGHRTSVGDLQYSQDGKLLIAVGGKNQAITFNAENGEIIAKSAENVKPLNWLSINSDGTMCAVASWGAADIQILETKTLKPINSIQNNGGTFMLDFSPTSNDLAVLAIVDKKQTIRIYDGLGASVKKEIFKEGSDKTFPTAVEFSPDGKFLACGISNANQGIRIWDASTGELKLTINHPDDITDIDYSSDGKYISGGGTDKNVYIWNAETGALVKKLTGYNGYVSSVDFSPDGAKIIAAGRDRDCRFMMWDVASGSLLQEIRGRGADVNTVSFSPDGLSMAMALQTYGDAFDVATVLIFKSGAAVEAAGWHVSSPYGSSVEFPKEPTTKTKSDAYYEYTNLDLTDGYFVYGYYGVKYKYNIEDGKKTKAERDRADFYRQAAEKIEETTFSLGNEKGIDLVYYKGTARYHYRIIFIGEVLHQWSFSARNDKVCPEETRIINSFKVGNSMTTSSTNSNSNSNSSGSKLKIGDRVKGNWKGQGTWYPGKIAKIAEGKYYIEYDDGDVEWVTPSNIKKQ